MLIENVGIWWYVADMAILKYHFTIELLSQSYLLEL